MGEKVMGNDLIGLIGGIRSEVLVLGIGVGKIEVEVDEIQQ